MGTIAKGEITLSPVNDAYTVLLTPSSCSISADFDGSNPNLTNAKGTITVKRGTKIVPFKIDGVSYSDSGIKISWVQQEVTVMPFVVTHIPNTILDGYVKFHIITQDGFNYSTEVQFAFNIVRESTMLDWIQDWEGSKTKVSGTYIMTPKLFVGKKEAILDMTNPEPTWKEGALTGVYIGPDLLTSGESSVGIYGYLKDKKIFHINADGGFIGGWTFNEEGLQSFNGIVNILSEGSIYAQNPDSEIPYWGIYANGTASFANGNVRFFANGDAEFIGKIISASGTIGGWNITKNQLHNKKIILDSLKGVIGICSNVLQSGDNDTGDLEFPDTPDGGVKLWYNSAMDFGMAGWTTGEKVFQLGSTNFIAGWNFNHQAIWTGGDTPSLTQGGYTSDLDAITIAPNGIRSNKWYVDANGTASFVGGSVKFNKESGEMFGWLMRSGRFSSQHAALISDPSNGGVYISITDITEVSVGSLRTTIENNGGIYLYSDSTNAIMRAYDKSGKIGFSLNTSGYNTISSWSFDSTAIYIGSKELTSDNFSAKNGSMVLMASGLFGYKWKLLSDGSGALANNKIKWDTQGNITVDAQISANNITAGTISTADIECKDKWKLSQDGSGYVASGKISWDKTGNASFTGKITATSGNIGNWQIINGVITSGGSTQYIKLDADNLCITTQSSYTYGDYDMNQDFGAILKMDANNGVVEAKAKSAPNYSTAVSYMSSNGIFSNIASINGMPASSGYTHRGAIVGLGFANVAKSSWAINAIDTIVAGVYGRASNRGTAPAYGGFFYNLYAGGLVLGRRCVEGKSNTFVYLNQEDTMVIGYTSAQATVYLPANPQEGQIVFFKQWWTGYMRVTPRTGHVLYDDSTQNDYCDCMEGQMIIAIFTIGYITSGNTTTKKEAWLVSRFKF